MRSEGWRYPQRERRSAHRTEGRRGGAQGTQGGRGQGTGALCRAQEQGLVLCKNSARISDLMIMGRQSGILGAMVQSRQAAGSAREKRFHLHLPMASKQ